ncbi:MAG: cytochrome oxidase, partial [Planctomycetes bacterium]|nr:cytochrome oxidase [Planctomycetota bacterium]
QHSEQEVFGDRAGLAEPGRALLDTGCVQCHAVRGELLPGVTGIELSGIADRIQPQWFQEFLFNPADLKPGTRMPTFFPNGKSANPAVLGGSVDRQIAAMWTYLKEIDQHRLPDKIIQARSQNFELVPKNRPILLRTFMEQAGTQAIAVGFPQRVHIAFDAEGVRLAQAWRGRFLDAHGTWFDRFAPAAAPLGEDIVAFPTGVPLALLTDPEQPWPTPVGDEAGYRFSGYRLDQQGVPTFLYRFNHFDVADRIEPDERRGLKRRLLITNLDSGDRDGADLSFRAIVGKKPQRTQPGSFAAEDGLTATVKGPDGDGGALREIENTFEWIIPIVVDKEETIDVEYRW